MTSPNQPISRSAARLALLTNLLVMPGVGSWMAGQRKLGAAHFLLSLAGLFLMITWVCCYLFDWIKREAMPPDLGPHPWVAITGVALFAGAWLWSLMSSLALMRRAGDAPAAAINQPPRLH